MRRRSKGGPQKIHYFRPVLRTAAKVHRPGYWDGSHFVGCTDTGNWMKSWDNGQSWVSQTPPGGVYTSYAKSLTWNGSVFAVIQQFGTGSPQIWTSPTGETGSWTARKTLGNSSNNFQYMMAKNGVFVSVGTATINSVTQGAAWVSTDNGLTWTLYPLPGGANPDSGCADSTNFWFVNHQTAGYAPDGINWTTVALNLTNTTPCSIGANDTFVLCLGISYGVGARIQRTFVTPGTETLSTVVSAECLNAGLLSAGDLDVTALTPSVRGYRMGTIGAIRAAIEPLQAAWPFDVRQHGYQIQFVARGGAS